MAFPLWGTEQLNARHSPCFVNTATADCLPFTLAVAQSIMATVGNASGRPAKFVDFTFHSRRFAENGVARLRRTRPTDDFLGGFAGCQISAGGDSNRRQSQADTGACAR